MISTFHLLDSSVSGLAAIWYANAGAGGQVCSLTRDNRASVHKTLVTLEYMNISCAFQSFDLYNGGQGSLRLVEDGQTGQWGPLPQLDDRAGYRRIFDITTWLKAIFLYIDAESRFFGFWNTLPLSNKTIEFCHSSEDRRFELKGRIDGYRNWITKIKAY